MFRSFFCILILATVTLHCYSAPDSLRYVRKGQTSFIENRGQWNSDVQYASMSPLRQTAFYKNGVYLSRVLFPDGLKDVPAVEQQMPALFGPRREHSTVNFVLPSPDMSVSAGREYATKSQFYRGRDTSAWVEYAANFGTVVYNNVWPNIDVEYEDVNGVLHQRFVVHEGGNVSDISLDLRSDGTAVDGMRIVSVQQDGSTLGGGAQFYEVNGVTKVDLMKRVKGPFLIDSEFSTYIGEDLSENVSDLLVTEEGGIYASGATTSRQFPQINALTGTVNFFDTTYRMEYFVRLSEDGSSLVFSTYIYRDRYCGTWCGWGGWGGYGGWGGSGGWGGYRGWGRGHLLAEGAAQTVWLAAPQTTYGSVLDETHHIWRSPDGVPITTDALEDSSEASFLMRFEPDGTLRYCTYLGEGLSVVSMRTDPDHNVYVLGDYCFECLSPPYNPRFPNYSWITPGTLGDIYQAPSYTVVVKLGPDGKQVLLGTYVPDGDPADKGIRSLTHASDLAIDSERNIIVYGDTEGDIPLVNAYDTLRYYPGHPNYLMKMNSTATSLIFSTYHKVGSYNWGGTLEVDSRDNIIYGSNLSSGRNGISALLKNSLEYPSPYNKIPEYSGFEIYAIFGRISPEGELLNNSTVTRRDSQRVETLIEDIAIDECDNVFLLGYGRDYPDVYPRRKLHNSLAPLQYPRTNRGGEFILALDSSFSELRFSSFWNWVNGAINSSLRDDTLFTFGSIQVRDGNVYVAGNTKDSELPLQHAYQDTLRGPRDGYISKLRIPFCNVNVSCHIEVPDSIVMYWFNGKLLEQRFMAGLMLENRDVVDITDTRILLEHTSEAALQNPGDTMIVPSPGVVKAGTTFQYNTWFLVDTTLANDTTITLRTATFYTHNDGRPDYTICDKEVKIVIQKLFVSCDLNVPDSVLVNEEGTDLTNNPFSIVATVTNPGNMPIDIDHATLRLVNTGNVRLVPPDDSVRAIGTIQPNGQSALSWTAFSDRVSANRIQEFELYVYDKNDNELTQCHTSIALPYLRGLFCEGTEGDTVVVNNAAGAWVPDPIRVTAWIYNDLDIQQKATAVTVDLSSAPHLQFAANQSAQKYIYEHSAKTTEAFTFRLEPVLPIAQNVVDTVWFAYQARTDTVTRRCFCVVEIRVPEGAVCTLSGPEQLNVVGTGYDNNPFQVQYSLMNPASIPLPVTEITIQLPSYITTTDPLTQSVSSLAPSAQHDITWPLTALTSAYDRDAVITVTAKDGEGNILSVCEHTVFIPGVDALSCEAEVPLPPVFDVALNAYKPNPFEAVLTVYNQLDSALTNVEVEVQISSSDVVLDGTANPQVYPSLAAGSFKTNNWRFRINTLLDKQTTVTVTFRTRSDQYPDWHECSVDVTIPPRQYTYCADCTADGIDTVWSNNTNEIMLPVPFQVYTAVANNCTGDLSNVQCTITLPSELSLAPGVNRVQTIKHIAPGDTMYAFWDVMASPNQNDYTSQIQIEVTTSEIATPSVCNHTVRIVHTDDIQLNPAKKLVYFMAVQDGNLPAAQSVMVYAGFPTEMPWTAQYPSWLDVSPTGSNTSESVSIQPNTTSLPYGRYWGKADFASPQPNAPKFVDVVYDVVDVTGVGSLTASVNGLQLHANYPNPFSHSTTIKYTTRSAQPVSLTVYNTLGIPVRVIQRDAQPGEDTVQISGLNPGIYMLVLQGKDGVATRMMIAK